MSVAPRAARFARVPLAGAGRARATAARAIVVLALSAVAAGALATLTSSSSGGPAPVSSPEIAATPAAQASLFAILRTPRTRADAVPALRAGGGPLGANPMLGRSIHEPRGGLSSGLVSVVPAHGAICLRVPLGRALVQWFCQGLAAAARGELLMALRPPGPLRRSAQLVIGLVPDGVRTVTISAAGGVRRTVRVRSNVFDVELFAPQRVAIDLPGRGIVSYQAP